MTMPWRGLCATQWGSPDTHSSLHTPRKHRSRTRRRRLLTTVTTTATRRSNTPLHLGLVLKPERAVRKEKFGFESLI